MKENILTLTRKRINEAKNRLADLTTADLSIEEMEKLYTEGLIYANGINTCANRISTEGGSLVRYSIPQYDHEPEWTQVIDQPRQWLGEFTFKLWIRQSHSVGQSASKDNYYTQSILKIESKIGTEYLPLGTPRRASDEEIEKYNQEVEVVLKAARRA